jgi:hypothetical protein
MYTQSYFEGKGTIISVCEEFSFAKLDGWVYVLPNTVEIDLGPGGIDCISPRYKVGDSVSLKIYITKMKVDKVIKCLKELKNGILAK